MKKLEKVTRFQIQTLPGFWNNTKNHRGTMLSHLNPNSKVSNLSASLVKIQLECNLINFFVGGSKTKELLRRWLKFGQLSSKKSIGEKIPKSKCPSCKVISQFPQ